MVLFSITDAQLNLSVQQKWQIPRHLTSILTLVIINMDCTSVWKYRECQIGYQKLNYIIFKLGRLQDHQEWKFMSYVLCICFTIISY